MHLNKLHLLKNQTAYQHKHPNNCHAGWLKDVDLGLLCSHSIWAPYNHWVNHELLCMPEYCEVKFQTFCAVTKAWLKLCQVKMTNSKQWHKYTAEWVEKKKKKRQSKWLGPVKVPISQKLKCRQELKRAVNKKMPTKKNEPTLHWC